MSRFVLLALSLLFFHQANASIGLISPEQAAQIAHEGGSKAVILDTRGGLPDYKAKFPLSQEYPKTKQGQLPMRFYLSHLAQYPNVKLYEGSWKEYAALKELPASTEASPISTRR